VRRVHYWRPHPVDEWCEVRGHKRDEETWRNAPCPCPFRPLQWMAPWQPKRWEEVRDSSSLPSELPCSCSFAGKVRKIDANFVISWALRPKNLEFIFLFKTLYDNIYTLYISWYTGLLNNFSERLVWQFWFRKHVSTTYCRKLLWDTPQKCCSGTKIK
jgi:hypothetical protein